MNRKKWPPDDDNTRGLVCPECGCAHFFVIYTRRAIGNKITRRRECRHCGKRMTTVESEGVPRDFIEKTFTDVYP